MAKRLLTNLFLLLIFLSFAKITTAAETEKYITIVNPVRIAPYTRDLIGNINTQYQTTEDLDLPATWLITYDVLKNDEAINIFKSFSDDHEIGLWLEIGKSLTDDANIAYHDEFDWHYSNNIFLSAYQQKERKIMIDIIFNKFKSNFGYYPKSVGSWWTDSYSINYMKEKYGIVANVGVSDQFSTDGYQVWGQYWSKPFVINKNNPAIPGDKNHSSDVINLQWASRDPDKGYKSSLYSVQDYRVFAEPKPMQYFYDIVDLYLDDEVNDISNVVIGFETDLSDVNFYKNGRQYYDHIFYVKNLQQKNVSAVTVTDFANKYFSKIDSSKVSITKTEKFSKEGTEVYWYQSPNYRVGLKIDTKNKFVEIFDLRFYDQDFIDPYYFFPNEELKLEIYLPAIIDSYQSDQVLKINYKDELNYDIDSENLILNFNDQQIIFNPDNIQILEEYLPFNFFKDPRIKIESNFVKTNNDYFRSFGNEFITINSQLKYFIKSKKNIIITLAVFIAALLIAAFLFKDKKYKLFLILILVYLTLIIGLYKNYTDKFYISHSELDTLAKLKSLPDGTVLVPSRDCLQCSWQSPSKPAVFSNNRGYVSEYSDKKIYKSDDVFEMNRTEGYEYLRKNNIKYIYLVNYAEYKERLPYQPGDFGVELIYSNANTQLWEVLPQ